MPSTVFRTSNQRLRLSLLSTLELQTSLSQIKTKAQTHYKEKRDGIEPGTWSPEKRKNYNLLDAVSRNTIQVYPKSWAAIMTTLDNAGMWNLRSMSLERQYLGQQLYISVLSPAHSLRDEYNIPDNAPLCGIVKDLPVPTPYSV
ncbi:unnamed protein product [Ilex paraguariensis]|uniref:Plastocyanin-like domain-containing protein n=1 Tax=Ilex paraguariensis TaxID=185542 RepID=A0ABC8QZ92_9AQUA